MPSECFDPLIRRLTALFKKDRYTSVELFLVEYRQVYAEIVNFSDASTSDGD